MPGHVFLVLGDITRLRCSAWALPTDRDARVEPNFLRRARPGLRSHGVPRLLELDPSTRQLLRARGVARYAGWGRGPSVYLVDVGRLRANRAQWFADRAVAFIDTALEVLDSRSGSRPLLALPFLGSGKAGATAIKGDVADRLLRALYQRVGRPDSGFDVALVTFSGASFAAFQQLRRTLVDEGVDLWPELGQKLRRHAEQLGDRAAQGDLVLFIGAGVSASAGLPTWDELLDQLGRRAKLSPETLNRFATEQPLDRARLVADELGASGRHIGRVVASLMRAKRYGIAHSLLASLPVREVTTTNYDRLFEAAAADSGEPVAVLPYERIEPGGRWLLKLHGSTEHPQDIVLTREDYLDYPIRRGALRGLVQGLLITRHMLFVGFSLKDENFLGIAHDVRLATQPGNSPRSRRRFGTVLTLFPDEVRRRLWERDVAAIAMDTAPPAEDDEASIHRAGRRLEIFLDRLVHQAAPASVHLLDRTYADALGPDEQLLRKSLEHVAAQAARVPGEAASWRRVRALLRDFGHEE
jgi:hypothetical protein